MCLSVCPTGYLRNVTRDLYVIFVPVAYVCGSVILRHIDDRPHRLSPGRGFLPHCNALAAKGIIPSLPRSRKMGSAG